MIASDLRRVRTSTNSNKLSKVNRIAYVVTIHDRLPSFICWGYRGWLAGYSTKQASTQACSTPPSQHKMSVYLVTSRVYWLVIFWVTDFADRAGPHSAMS